MAEIHGNHQVQIGQVYYRPPTPSNISIGLIFEPSVFGGNRPQTLQCKLEVTVCRRMVLVCHVYSTPGWGGLKIDR